MILLTHNMLASPMKEAAKQLPLGRTPLPLTIASWFGEVFRQRGGPGNRATDPRCAARACRIRAHILRVCVCVCVCVCARVKMRVSVDPCSLEKR